MSEEVSADTGTFSVGFAAGFEIAGYRLDGEIGRGSAAAVYRARDERLGRLVALKILAPELTDDEQFRQWFVQELRAVTEIRNPHIVPVFEAGQADGMLYLAMRHVPGGDALSLARREGPLPVARVAAIIWQTASALDAMHAAGLMHRDVKPANILVDTAPGRRDWVYLSDFALRREPAQADGPSWARSPVSTLACAAPELIEGGPADGRADEYALAASAFELLTGWPPFVADDPAALLHAHVTQPSPALTSRRPELPPAADDVVGRALAKAPEQRYPSCREFAAALAGSLGLRPPPPTLVHSAGPVSGPAPNQIYLAMPSAPAPRPEEPVPAPAPALLATRPPLPEPVTADAPVRTPAGRGEPWLVRRERPRFRRAAIAVAVIAVLAAASVAVVTTGVLRSPARKPAPPPRVASFPITARSALAPQSGDVWVMYHGGAGGQAQVSGEVKEGAKGYVARLYAQPFPFSARPAVVASVALHPKHKLAPYAFTVTPSLATRYYVSVFAGRKARKSLGRSPSAMIYVATSMTRGKSQPCRRPTCHETFTLNVYVPPLSLSSEISKRWYTYFALNTSKSAKPPAGPAVLRQGAGSPKISAPKRVSADEYAVTLTFTFPIGKKGGYTWLWAACVQGSETTDGVGLPGAHGCGAKAIPTAHSYLG
ncbi:MAG TPA: serine/threonine-protein kinase [Streptosporangiaceae bacterium]|nr:serine/threonine-protein kinase [Streptosporangiaceae bacterium]